MTPLEIVVDSEITLKSWEVSSAPQLFALVDSNREHLSQWLPWVPFVKEVSDSAKFIKESHQDWEKERSLELGVWYKNELTGCLGLHHLDMLNLKTAIGYWLGQQYEGKGIMSRSVQALTNWCFTQRDFNRVEIDAATQNHKSLALPQRLGYVREGVLRQAGLVQGEFQDLVVFSMLKEDWSKHAPTN